MHTLDFPEIIDAPGLFTIACADGMLIATVPDGSDVEAAIAEVENQGNVTIDRASIIIETGLVLTDEPRDDDDIRYYGGTNAPGWLTAHARAWGYAVRRSGPTARRVMHTPGPWEVQDDTDVIDRRGYFVATAHDPSSDVGTLEEYANARLISAAPDLLAVLKEVADYWAGGDVPADLDARMRAVIAAATGR